MNAVRFVVGDIFDLPGRGGLLLTGRLESGNIRAGDVLRNATGRQPIHVIGIELHAPHGLNTIIVSRDPASAAVTAGSVLVGGDPGGTTSTTVGSRLSGTNG